MAEIETLSGFKGPDLAGMLIYDKANIGFSLRALGAVEARPDGTMMVKQPIRPITYDIVSNPSHATARVLNFLPEAVENIDHTGNLLYESDDMSMLQMDSIHICENGLCSIKFINDIIEESFHDSMMKTNFSFKI